MAIAPLDSHRLPEKFHEILQVQSQDLSRLAESRQKISSQTSEELQNTCHEILCRLRNPGFGTTNTTHMKGDF